MSILSSSFIFICALLGVQKCHGVLNVPLQDSIVMSAYTPFDDYGNVNYAVIAQLAQYYKDNNLKVIYVNGYFGEAALLPLSERKRLVKTWNEQANCQGFDLIVEVGALPFDDALELARYCSELNVTAITAFAELVYQAVTLEEALEDLQRICDAASNLPLLYHELVVVDPNIKTDEIFLGAMDERVSCFVGVLTTVNTYLDIKAAVDSVDGYQLWAYGINAIAAALKVEMNATESVNLFPDLAWKIKDAVNKCQLDRAADLQQEMNRRLYAITNLNGGTAEQTDRSYITQEKAAFELLSGIKMGYRYPLDKPNSKVISQIQTNLESFGVRLYSPDNNN